MATAHWPSLDAAEELAQLLDGYVAELKAGKTPDRQKLLADHPALAQQLEQCLAGLEFIHSASKPTATPMQLGDFRVIRELGRGGMGVVYEAEQLSLRRRVALKVLRFGAVADEEALERFRREAETVAHLHHTNIVPIFAVGSEHGVYYYAMQFITGGSLAEKLADGGLPTVQSGKTSDGDAAPSAVRNPNTAIEVARWGLEAAEALAHAHQRGVIHRDIKPSNLLLDADGRVWLTDFGLARRTDEVMMTITGMVMGTPRYMSPEQATAVTQPVDHRTDIYSLGATLYELATGKPVFTSDTPHGVISQILTAEPVRPRVIRHSIPRDFETIILKCLAKEPAQRYATAQTLADDLRAYGEGRAIKARRVNVVEQTARWVRKRKKNVAIAAAAVAATLLVMGITYSIMASTAAARLAHLFVRTEGQQHFKVEVLDEEEKAAVATFTAPTQESQAISPGKYHVRLSADGQLSETSLIEADKGSYYDVTAALSPRNMWDIPVQEASTVELARVDARDDMFLASQTKLRRASGESGQTIWEISLSPADQPLMSAALKLESATSQPVFGAAGWGADFRPLGLVRPLLDLDADGAADLIWASRTSDALLAVSGKSGELLWCHRSNPPPPAGIDEKDIASSSAPNSATVVGQPLLVEVDGREIVVALFFANGEPMRTKNDQWIFGGPRVWLEAVAAKTGESIWRHTLTPPNQDYQNSAIKIFSSTTALGRQGNRQIGEIAFGNRIYGFDCLNGEPVHPERELDEKAPLAVRIVDLAGDGELDVLFVREVATLDGKPIDDPANFNGNQVKRELTLVAQSPSSKTPLWERPLPKIVNPLLTYGSIRVESFDWPLVADLDGQGKPAVVVPYVDLDAPASGLEVLDGRTGKTHWQRRLSAIREDFDHYKRPVQIDRIAIGPDLDGDGYRELFAASYDQQAYRTYVDALSGRDGRSFWNHTEQLPYFLDGSISPLRWWEMGADGQPLLVVSFGDGMGKIRSLILASATGRIEHVLTEFGEPQIADLNGDGLPDLFAHDARNYSGQGIQFAAGKLRAIKGTPPVEWRILNNNDFALRQDYNRDGFTDLLSQQGNLAMSGRDGSMLWRADLGPWAAQGTISDPLPDGDLNGDGSPDTVYATNGNMSGYATIAATSGRDGTALWSSELKFGAKEFLHVANNMVPYLGCHVLEKGNSPDVLFIYTMGGTDDGLWRSWLARFSGRDGKLVWRVPLNEPNPNASGNIPLTMSTADLDGDGVNDILFWMPLTEAAAKAAVPKQEPEKGKPVADNAPVPLYPMLELLAYSGRDGKLLWRRPGFFTQNSGAGTNAQNLGRLPAPVVIDLDGENKPTVLITDVSLSSYNPNRQDSYAEVVALDGRDGKDKWSWRGDWGIGMDSNSQWADGSPQVVRTAAGPAVCVSIADQSLKLHVDPNTKVQTPSGKSGHQIVLLSARGEVLRRTEIMSPNSSGGRPRIWVADLDGDGHDELVWRDESQVRAMHADGEKLLWEWNVPRYPDGMARGEVRAILPAGADHPAVVAVCDQDTLYGLAGPTGVKRWRCDTTNVFNSGVLDINAPQGLPRVWSFGPGTVGNCRMGLATNEAGEYLPLKPTTRTYDKPVDNPRLLRPLPWVRHSGLPYVDYSFGPRTGVPGMIVATALIALVIGLRPGKLRRAAGIIILWLILSSANAVVILWKDSRTMGSMEHYDLSGWYEILAPGFAITMWMMLVGMVVVGIYRFVRWTVKRLINNRHDFLPSS